MSYQQVITRHASDDFYVLLAAQGMENAGATVVSVFPINGYFSVLGVYDPEKTTCDQIDTCIEEQLNTESNYNQRLVEMAAASIRWPSYFNSNACQ